MRAGAPGSRAPKAQALPRTQRIRKRAEFVRTQQSPARVATRHLLMLLSLRVEKGPARLGVVASRKVGPAVARNRAKRLVREAFRRNPTVFPEGLDVVIVVRPGIHRLTQGDVDEQVRKARPLLSLRAAELHKERPRAGSPSALEEAPGDPPDPTRDRLRRR